MPLDLSASQKTIPSFSDFSPLLIIPQLLHAVLPGAESFVQSLHALPLG